MSVEIPNSVELHRLDPGAALTPLDKRAIRTAWTPALAQALMVPVAVATAVMFALTAAFASTAARGEAVTLLREAHERFAEMGATWPRDQAARLLRDAGSFPVVSMAPARQKGPRHPLDPLTERERDVARQAVQGMSSRAIALRLCISERTVENHLQKAYAKLGVHSRAELIALVAGTHALASERAAT